MAQLDALTRWMQTEVAGATMMARAGKVTEVVGMLMCVSGLDAKVGELCDLPDDHGQVERLRQERGASNLMGARRLLALAEQHGADGQLAAAFFLPAPRACHPQ